MLPFINEDYKIDFNLPKFLKADIKELEEAIMRRDMNLDVYQDNVAGSINIALDVLTPEQINVLRKRYWL